MIILMLLMMQDVSYQETLSNTYRDLYGCCLSCTLDLSEARSTVAWLEQVVQQRPPVSFQECMTGPTTTGAIYLHTLMLACSSHDHDGDGDIDLRDWIIHEEADND